jgi:hypothetical protein
VHAIRDLNMREMGRSARPVVSELEGQFGEQESSFQYLVTTTTRPPNELATPPFVRLTFDAHNDEGRLLRTRF